MIIKSAIIVAFLTSSMVWAAAYKIDNSHSEIGFSVKHMMISNVKGFFSKYEGGFDYDEKAKTVSNVNVKIEVASVSTGEKKRDDHLTSPDFFDAGKYPTIEFKADKISGVEPGKTFKVPGTLTMHGVTKPITLQVEFHGSTVGMMGETRIGFTATTKVKRTDYGVTWNKTLDKGGVAVGEEVSVTIDSESIRPDTVKKK